MTNSRKTNRDHAKKKQRPMVEDGTFPDISHPNNKSQTTTKAMSTHNLKTWMPFYQDVIDGRKTFELRKNDRDYQVGDILT